MGLFPASALRSCEALHRRVEELDLLEPLVLLQLLERPCQRVPPLMLLAVDLAFATLLMLDQPLAVLVEISLPRLPWPLGVQGPFAVNLKPRPAAERSTAVTCRCHGCANYLQRRGSRQRRLHPFLEGHGTAKPS